MPTVKTFSEQMVDKIQAILLDNPGVSSYTVDGVTTSFADLMARLQNFEAEVARENGQRQRFNNGVPLGSFSP